MKEYSEKECKELMKEYTLSTIPTIYEVYRKISTRGKIILTPRGYRILKRKVK